MKPSVLVIATRYDSASHCIYKWAHDLHEELVAQGRCEACLMFDGESLCRSGSSFTDAVDRVDYVVFYGHGLKDQWIALPASSNASTLPFVDVGTVHVLNGRNIYAACCFSLVDLGTAFASRFATQQPSPEFVGYKDAFNVHIPNQKYFSQIVNESVKDFILNKTPAATIETNQKASWDQLKTDFSTGGRLQYRPDAVFAASCARQNQQSVGYT